MKSSIRAAVAAGVLALAATQASASTYSNMGFAGFTGPITLAPGGSDEIKAFDTPVSFSVNTLASDVYTTFSLVDTQDDGKLVQYDIKNLTTNLVTTNFLQDAVNAPNTGSFSYLFLAGIAYSINISSLTLGYDSSHTALVSAVPLPAAAWLFGSALLGLGALRRKQKAGNSEMAAV